MATDQFTIMENLHPIVVAPTRDLGIKLAKEYMATHPATTMYVVKVVAIIETTHTQRLTLKSR
jgi:hypothetical protein